MTEQKKEIDNKDALLDNLKLELSELEKEIRKANNRTNDKFQDSDVS